MSRGYTRTRRTRDFFLDRSFSRSLADESVRKWRTQLLATHPTSNGNDAPDAGARRHAAAEEVDLIGAAPGPRKILVVDDDAATGRAISAVLAGAGYEPLVCSDGGHAIACAEQHRPDAAMVDIHLPDL